MRAWSRAGALAGPPCSPLRGDRFVGVAEWPDRATWQAAFDAKMVYDQPATRRAFVDAIAEAGDRPLLLMEVTDDLLARD